MNNLHHDVWDPNDVITIDNFLDVTLRVDNFFNCGFVDLTIHTFTHRSRYTLLQRQVNFERIRPG